MLLFALITASLTVILHDVGIENSLYNVYWWFDIVTHGLGGFTLGAVTATLFQEKKWSAAIIVCITIVPIIGWELFEVIFAVVSIEGVGYTSDTVIDVMVGLFGACSAALVYKKR